MATHQTVWPAFALPLPYELSVPGRPPCPGLRLLPCGCSSGARRPKESRRFFLDRYVFDLVDAHPYLSLTDPKLLSWYLSLSPEDRKIIQDEGGFHQFLQRHPALELSRHHVYVKYNIGRTGPAQSTTTTPNEHTSRTSGAKKQISYTASNEMPHTDLKLDMLPNNVRETLTLLGCSNSSSGSQKHPREEICHTAFNSPVTQEPNHQPTHTMRGSSLSQLNEESSSWQMASSAAVCRDPASLASFSVDMELERHRQAGKPELRRQMVMTQGQSATFKYAAVSQLQPEWPTVEKESPSEYYSFDSIQMDGPENTDSIPSVKPEHVSSPLDPVEENNTMEWSLDSIVCGNVDDDEASFSSEEQSDNFHSIMEDDKSILVCLASEALKAHDSGAHSGPVTATSEALAASSETLKSDQPVTEMNAPALPCVNTCDIMVGNDPAPCMSAFTQTEDPGTSDKHVVTEVHMADLDYLAEEFIKLKSAKEELRGQKEKMKSSGCKLREECDCVQRAQQAELCLLALQYSMCTQHCWRLYGTSAEGGQLTPIPKNPSAQVLSVLQKLESDFNQMRDKILAGVPLEQLKPLSVDSERITMGTSYTPAQISDYVLGKVPSRSSQDPQKHDASGERNECPQKQSRNGCQHSQQNEKRIKKENSKAKRAVALVPQDRDAIHNAPKQTTAACKELNTSEAWYDAEEDLEPAGASAAAETTVIAKDTTNESASEEATGSVLCVSNLPSNVTERDVMLWFEKYHASDVSISALKNDLRVAIVMISGAQSAEAAVSELHGSSMQGHRLHVEHINRAVGGSQSRAAASVRGPETPQDAVKPQTSKTDSSSAEGKTITQPPFGCSIKNRKVVCISPTAKGTCVPQHYGTMGSFDTLMAELTQRHPDVGRQRIVDALVALRSKHQGVLSGLPLRTIREMTSELLSRPAGATQS